MIIINNVCVCVCCIDLTPQIQQPVLMAPQYPPCLSKAVGGSQENECHRLGRKISGAGEQLPVSECLILYMLYSYTCYPRCNSCFLFTE